MCILIICNPVCDVMSFKINFSFLVFNLIVQEQKLVFLTNHYIRVGWVFILDIIKWGH